MRVLVLNGSPRVNGTIDKILNEISLGTDFEKINIHDLDFDYCHGCMACRTKGNCILKKDDAHYIAEKIKEAEILIVGSPCYWGNISGKMKMLFDRIVYVMMKESRLGIPVPMNKNKKCIIVTACTTPFPFNLIAKQSSGVVREIKEIVKCSGFKCIGVIQKGGTKKSKLLTKKELSKCRKLNKKLKEGII